jgi:hypothetical protein
LRRFRFLFAAFVLSGCGTIAPPCAPPDKGDVVYVVEAGWHAEIGIPVDELGKNMQFVKKTFPGARTIMIGYGKQTFFTAPVDTPSEYLLGPFPGPAVIHMVGLKVLPPEAYPDDTVITLALPPGGSRALSAYIWNDLTKDDAGKPVQVATSTNPAGLFYGAQSEYNLMHTCNSWTADALRAAGLPISGGDVFADQVTSSASEVAAHQCPLR